jgi:hypothetical protein
MGKFDAVIEKYTTNRVSTDNIDFAISAIKDGTRREHILENLTADYRGMKHDEANAMLEDLFATNGGEFKKENNNGYLFGIVFLFFGGACSFYIFYVFYYGGVLVRPILVFIGAFSGLVGGISYIIKSMKGKFRHEDDPFSQN